jgi:hypothetical protein
VVSFGGDFLAEVKCKTRPVMPFRKLARPFLFRFQIEQRYAMDQNKKTLRNFLTIIAVYSLFNCIGAVFFPKLYSEPFGVTLETSGLIFAKYLGALALGLAVLTWTGRNLTSRETLLPVLLGNFVAYGASILVTVYSILTGDLNPLGWILVAVDFLIIAMFGYYLFINKNRGQIF